MSNLKNDIEKYLRGELPDAEMHALEKRALNDPFLADALEGAAGIEDTGFTQDMSQLSKKLAARVSPKKVIPLWMWPARIAAGLLVIAIATYVIVSLQKPDRQSENTAYKAEQKTPEPGTAADTLRPGLEGGYLSMNATKEERKAETNSAPASPRPSGEVTAAKPEAEQFTVQQETRRIEAAEPAPESPAEISSELAREAPSVAAAPPVMTPMRDAFDQDDAKSKRRASPAVSSDARKDVSISSGYYSVSKQDSAVLNTRSLPPHVVTGRVTGDDGAGLPGVNVVIKGSSTGTVTDIQGNYQVNLNDPQTTLVFSFIGMESKEVPVSNSPTVDVSLNADAAELSEVVVVGYGESKDEDTKSFPTFDMAEPVGGKRAFKKYLEDKMVYPQEALDNKIEGRVTVQFTVETSGQISNLNVIKGIGYGCDDEVIRLIKEGPRWSAMKRDDEPVKGRVRVRMRFTLPKKK